MRTKLSQFKYKLPKKLIAQYPAENRDEARLMVVHRDSGKIEHKVFKDIVDYFDEDDAMIFNNTKVFPARLYGKKDKTEANIEVFLLHELNEDSFLWDVMVDPARKIRVGNKLYFKDDDGNDLLTAEVIDNTTSRGRTIRFFYEGEPEEFRKQLYSIGTTPLPKYMGRAPELEDIERYQTIFAKETGAVAAPSAGLHFSEMLMKRLELKGINFSEITLHAGLGTFRKIAVEDLSKHKMDAEKFHVTAEAAEVVNQAITKNRRVCAVGTTTMRTIESSVSSEHLLKESKGWTNLFIFQPYDFHIANSMITNFHPSQSSLLIMTCAFGGYELIMDAYQAAIKEEYRFHAYGDAMLIL